MHIVLINDKFGITKPKEFKVRPGLTLLDWLIEYFGPHGSDRKLNFYKHVNGETKEINNTYEELNKKYEEIVILQNPAGVQALWIAYAVLVVASFVLIKPPRLNQADATERGKSPNNALNAQTNEARRLQRIPEIFGKVVAFPDLIAESIFEYQNQVKVQTEVFCIGRGFYDLSNFKSGETLISDIPEASIEIFEPGEQIPNLKKIAISTSVVDQNLNAPNEIFTNETNDWRCSYDLSEDILTINDQALSEQFVIFEEGDNVEVVGLITFVNIGGSPTNVNLSGEYVLGAVTSDSIELLDVSTIAPEIDDDDLGDFSNRQFNSGDGTIALLENTGVGPVTVPGEDYSEILYDIEAPQGIATGNALTKFLQIDFEIFVEEINESGNPTGPNFTLNESVSGDSSTPKFYTFKVDTTDGLIVGNRYRTTVTRTTKKDLETTRAERLTFTRLASTKVVDGSDNVGTTRARITLQANEQTINIQDRRFNVECVRKCLTYSNNQVVGNLTTGVGLVSSQKFADAFLTYFLDSNLANKTINLLDVGELYSIQNKLDNVFSGLKGHFNFTFDSNSASAQEELFTIADSVRCFIVKTGSFYNIARDEIQTNSLRMINRSLKKPNSERKSIKFNDDTDKDGVEFTYFDFDKNERVTIVLPDQLPAADSLFHLPATQNPERIDGVGITNFTQAWDRAQYEFRKIVFTRFNVAVTVGASVGTLPLNSRVDFSDGTLPADIVGKSDGEILAIDGLNVITSEECEFIPNAEHEVVLTSENGEVQGPYFVEPLLNGSTYGFTFSASPAPDVMLRGENSYQRGTLYLFRASTDKRTQMLLQRKTPEDDFYYRCELINYTDEYYAADNQVPPSL